MKIGFKENIKTELKIFAMFCISIIYYELLLRLLIMEEEMDFPYFLLFVPAEALFLTFFCGWFKKKWLNRIIAILVLLLLSVFYIVQLLYYRQFGSPLSVSFLNMGTEAITDFWWAFEGTLKSSVSYIILMLIALGLGGVFLWTKAAFQEKTALIFKLVILVMTLALWIGATFGCRFAGQGKSSAYYVLTNAYSDTETSARKVGILTTSIVEAGAYYLGINSNNSSESFEPVTIEAEALKVEDVSSNDPIITIENTKSSSEEMVLDEVDKDDELSEAVKEVSYHINEGIDFEYLKTLTEDADIKALCDYFDAKTPESENEYTGLFEGYNLIYICAESFTTYGINEELTPLLWNMSHNGVVLNNYYSSFKNTTTNGEFAYSVSLWPDVSRKAADGNAVGSFACSATNYMPYGLGNIFNSMDVPTYAFHGYISSYYSRGQSWPNLGYKNIKFMYEGLSFANKWSPTDTELMEQTVDDFISDERFMAYYMTYSGHGDYNTDNYIYRINNQKVREILATSSYTDAEIAYLCGSYELEKAMEYLVEKLEESGQLEKTVIVLAGDHIPYNFTNEEMADMSSKAGLSYDNNFDKYKSTCIIYNAALSEPIISDEYCCSVDVLPTVLNLMGIDYDSRLIAGNDVLGSSLHRARLYDGNLITKYVNYNALSGKAIWKGSAENWVDAQKSAYIDNLTAYSDNEYKVSLKLMEKDFYRFVWEN